MVNLKDFTRSVVNSFLGPNKSNKFLIQDKNVCVTRCPLYILQNNHLQDPTSLLLEETLFAHHELYGCSTLSLLAMWYFWKEEFTLALEDGCDMESMVKNSQNMLELAISALTGVIVSVDNMIVSEKHSPKIVAGQNPFSKKDAFSQFPVSIQYSSRHFSPSSQNALNSENQDGPFREPSEVDEKRLKKIIQSLNHDDDRQISELVLECWKKQISSTSCTKFQKDGLLICPLVLPHCSSTVVDGLLVKSNLNHTWYLDTENGDASRTLIIMGSITSKYVHLGFIPKVSVSVESSDIPVISKEEQWRKMCCDMIMHLNIKVLLVKDDIDQDIANFCLAHAVLVLPQIPLKAFKMLCNALHYSPCTYLWDCKEESIIKNLVVKKWKPHHHHLDGFDQYYLFNVCLINTSPLLTIVICHSSQATLEMLKHQMQHLISRLSLTFQSGHLLPGGGETEKRCSDFLRKHSQLQKPSDQSARIMTALINGYQNFSVLVTRKNSLPSETNTLTNNSESNSSKVLDEMSSKVSAWRSALSLVLLMLQCDAAIVNGVSDSKIEKCVDLCRNTL